MRVRLFAIAVTLFTFSAISFAEHSDYPQVNTYDHSDRPNLRAAADYAHALASLGERYSRSYDYRLARAADALHYAASDLYRALRYRSRRGGFNTFDHSDRDQRLYQMLNQVNYLTQDFMRYAPYYAAQRAQSLCNAIERNMR